MGFASYSNIQAINQAAEDEKKRQAATGAIAGTGTKVDADGKYVRNSNGVVTEVATGRTMTQEDYNKEVALQAKNADLLARGFNPDGSPIRKDFESLIDPATGKLKSEYLMKGETIDPSKLEGYNMVKALAKSEGPTSLAKAQMDQTALSRKNAIDMGQEQVAGAQAQAMSALASRGGISSGARERLGGSSIREILAQKQNAYRQEAMSNADINAKDADLKVNLMKDFANAEGKLATYNNDIGNRTNEYNLNNTLKEIDAKRGWDSDAYKESLDKWSSNKQADATRSSGGGGGGCCFIFMEARYGTGTMDAVVRRFRDEHMNEKNKRGYYKLSEVLVPLMRKSKLVKFAVRVLMTDPMVSYGKYHYGEGKLGIVFKPVARFWLGMFEYLGGEHAFVRENGETV